jgi:transcriptional regulator with XRE-family HTH domain
LKQYEGEALNFHERRKRRLSERLRLLMDEKGLSVTAAARLVKEQLPGASFNPANISHYRAGRSVPRPNVLRALSAILNVDPEDLAPQQEAQEDVAIKPQAAKGFESEVSVVAKRGRNYPPPTFGRRFCGLRRSQARMLTMTLKGFAPLSRAVSIVVRTSASASAAHMAR